MSEQHPITPPPELVQQWLGEFFGCTVAGELSERYLAARAAQWGADAELEACIQWMLTTGYWSEDAKAIPALRAARRPKPPSLKVKALEQLDSFQGLLDMKGLRADTIRQALEQLSDS